MIVAELECPLFRQGHAGGKALVNHAHKCRKLLVIVDALTRIKLLQMLLSELDQGRENDGGRSASGVEVAIFDSSVDAGIRGVLHGLQHGKEPSENIGQIFAFVVECHGKYLLRAIF